MSSPPPQSAQGLLLAGRYVEALSAFEIALAARPGEAEALFGRATALKLMGRMEEARAGYDAVLEKMPGAPGALNNRGEVLIGLNQPEAALADFDRALARKPDFPPALLGRGIALQRLHRSNDALACFERACALWPDSPDVFFHRGLVLAQMGYSQEALLDYDRTIALQPDSAAAINNRSVTLIALRRFAEAAKGYAMLDRLVPGNAQSLNGLATAAMHACDWTLRQEFSEKIAVAIRAGHREIQPGTTLGYLADPALLLACAKNQMKGLSSPPLWTHKPFSAEKIKLAYCSADFNSHATSRLMAGLFEMHDRKRFEVIGVSFGLDDASPMRGRVVKAFDQFHDVRSKSERGIAALIAGLGVDIAIDLKGLTADSRPGIFALRPAPVQVNYLGYPGTMGADFMDAIIADPVVLPMEQQAFYTERIVHLPDCYQVNDASRVVTPAPTRAKAGLPGGFVFCCFNNNWKIAPPVFDIWMRLLLAVPGSVLWLLQDSDEAAANLRREAAARGVAQERLIVAPRVSPEEHLARHRLADLFLDTLPYNAHTGASDALWVGVPLVTLKGESFHGRVAASILSAIGLPELITENPADYERLALALASDGARLAALREKLGANRKTAPLFDTARFTRNLEAAYEMMGQDFLKMR
jgi:predicted O-linked N-acetylglucosamine transferase (SPINDLY family)